jgi:hypothetical protein
MEELYVEGLASHDGPESCAGVREGAGEALTGVRAGGIRQSRWTVALSLTRGRPWHLCRCLGPEVLAADTASWYVLGEGIAAAQTHFVVTRGWRAGPPRG